MKKNQSHVIWIVLVFCSALTAGIMLFIDKKASVEGTPKQNTEIKKDEVRKRECVSVELSQLRMVVSSARANDSIELGAMGDPVYAAKDGLTIITLDITPAGRDFILGNPSRWSERDTSKNAAPSSGIVYYRGTQLELPTQIIGEDTVVQCPAYIFAKLVRKGMNDQ